MKTHTKMSKKALEQAIEDYEGFLADVGQIEIDLMDALEEYKLRYGKNYEY